MNNNKSLPHFFIIGAMKCGTSSLHEYLDHHPDIAMSRIKEINYFSDDHNWKKGPEWYAEHFTFDERLRGESSHNYSNYPRMRAAERIAATVPDARFIYVVRDPIERARSHYIQRWMLRQETTPIEQALTEKISHNPYITRSRYFYQVEQYLRFYDRDRILVIDNRDLNRRPNETLAQVFEFLEVAPFTSDKFSIKHNISESKKKLSPFGESARKWILANLKPPQQLRNRLGALYQYFGTEEKLPTVSPELAVQLATYLRDDVREFEQFCGRSFEHWKV